MSRLHTKYRLIPPPPENVPRKRVRMRDPSPENDTELTGRCAPSVDPTPPRPPAPKMHSSRMRAKVRPLDLGRVQVLVDGFPVLPKGERKATTPSQSSCCTKTPRPPRLCSHFRTPSHRGSARDASARGFFPFFAPRTGPARLPTTDYRLRTRPPRRTGAPQSSAPRFGTSTRASTLM